MLENSMIYSQEMFDSAEDRWLKRLPKCDCCKDPIQDDRYIELPNGDRFCNECEKDNASELWFEWAREEFLIVNEEI